MKINIKSDGTPEGTSIVVDGVDVTKENQVETVNFSTYTWSDYVYFNWSTVEKDKNGVQKRVTYTYSPKEQTLRKDYIGKPVTSSDGIGTKNKILFDSTEDETNYKVLQKTLKLTDRVKVVEGIPAVKDEKK